jgi:DNA modification methylase
MYLDDAELSSIPPRIAERASRIGYKFKSFITWRKHTAIPEPAKSRVSRQAEYVLHLSVGRTPFFDKKAWQDLPPRLGGPNHQDESTEKITDIWSLPVSAGKNGHGAEFPLALAGRCIALTSREGDLVLDPFVGSGTTAVAAIMLGRRCLGYDISEKYIDVAEQRLIAAGQERQLTLEACTADVESSSAHAAEARTSVARRSSSTQPVGPVSSRTVAEETPRPRSA